MNKALLSDEVQNFIRKFRGDLTKLVLQKPLFEHITNKELAVQVRSLELARKKFPELTEDHDLIYPPKLHLEQSSSTLTAKFKAERLPKGRGVDLTGGFGIDTYYLAQTHQNIIYTDPDPTIASIAEHNFRRIGLENIQFHDLPAEILLDQLPMQLDWYLIDPSRRNRKDTKVVSLEDSEPNVVRLQEKLQRKFHAGMIKASPMLSIDKALAQLENVVAVHILAIKNEVKELLFQIDHAKEPRTVNIKCYDLNKDEPLIYQNEYQKDDKAQVSFSDVSNYLYQPHPSILKAGFFQTLAKEHSVDKIASDTHLYTSKQEIGFPGRSFKVRKVIPYKPKHLKKEYRRRKYHVITKNFGIKSEVIADELEFKPQGEDYLICFKDLNGKRLIADTELITNE